MVKLDGARVLSIVPVSLPPGGILTSSGILQRTHHLPDATPLVLQGIVFLVILTLAVMGITCANRRNLAGAPGALSIGGGQ